MASMPDAVVRLDVVHEVTCEDHHVARLEDDGSISVRSERCATCARWRRTPEVEAAHFGFAPNTGPCSTLGIRVAPSFGCVRWERRP